MLQQQVVEGEEEGVDLSVPITLRIRVGQIGEDAVNRALRQLLHDYAFKGPPYPTALDLVTTQPKHVFKL